MSKEFGGAQQERQLNLHEQRLPIEIVDNKVLYVDPEIEFPFDLKVGEQSSSLGVFLTSEPSSEARTVAVYPGHGRSGLVGKVFMRDIQGRLYHGVEAKGIGFLEGVEGQPALVKVGKPFVQRTNREGEVLPGLAGMAFLDQVEKDKKMADEFLAEGVRTYRVAAIIRLDSFISEGKLISVEQFLNKPLDALKPEETPVVEVRVFSVKDRISDAVNRPKAVEEAMRLVTQERGLSQMMTKEEYLQWFAATLGEQVGRMHWLGYVHGSLSTHNITLDCGIVDLDSVEAQDDLSTAAREEAIHLDRTAAIVALTFLAVRIAPQADALLIASNPSFDVRGEMEVLFDRNYSRVLRQSQ